MLSNYVEVALLVRYTELLLTFVFTKRLIFKLYLPCERRTVNTRGIYDAVLLVRVLQRFEFVLSGP
jgi:hypothetical protein